jgi:hypothetical protein
MAQTQITIEKLAEMINEGFKSTASKEDIQRAEVRLDRIENLLIEEQRRKIENLETRMKKLEDTLIPLTPHDSIVVYRTKSPKHRMSQVSPPPQLLLFEVVATG